MFRSSPSIQAWPLPKLSGIVNETNLLDAFEVNSEWKLKLPEMTPQDHVDVAFSLLPDITTYSKTKSIELPYVFQFKMETNDKGIRSNSLFKYQSMCCAVAATAAWNRIQAYDIRSAEVKSGLMEIARLVIVGTRLQTRTLDKYTPTALQPAFLELCGVVATMQIYADMNKYPAECTHREHLVALATIVTQWQRVYELIISELNLKPLLNALRISASLQYSSYIHKYEHAPQSAETTNKQSISCAQVGSNLHDAVVAASNTGDNTLIEKLNNNYKIYQYDRKGETSVLAQAFKGDISPSKIILPERGVSIQLSLLTIGTEDVYNTLSTPFVSN